MGGGRGTRLWTPGGHAPARITCYQESRPHMPRRVVSWSRLNQMKRASQKAATRCPVAGSNARDCESSWAAYSYWAGQEFPCVCWTRRPITVFTKVHHWTLLSWARWIQSIYLCPTSPRFTLILSSLLHIYLWRGLFQRYFWTKLLYFYFSVCTTFSPHLIILCCNSIRWMADGKVKVNVK